MGMKYRYWEAVYYDGGMGEVDAKIQKTVETACELIRVFGDDEFRNLFEDINSAVKSSFKLDSVPDFGWLMRNTDNNDVDGKGNPIPENSKAIEVLHGDKLRSTFYFVREKDGMNESDDDVESNIEEVKRVCASLVFDLEDEKPVSRRNATKRLEDIGFKLVEKDEEYDYFEHPVHIYAEAHYDSRNRLEYFDWSDDF